MTESWDAAFDAELFHWRGPAPYEFLAVPPGACAELAELAPRVSYGWGMIPATVRIGGTEWTTALWPKDGGYVVPVKAMVRRREELDDGAVVQCELRVDLPGY